MTAMRRYLIPSLAALTICTMLLAQSVRVGPLATPDANNATPRGGRYGETIVQAAGGANKERVRRGGMYFACDQGSGVAPGTALGTTAMLSVYNPANSGVLVVIRRVYAPYLSGTLGTGNLYHCVNTSTTQTAPASGTLLANTPALAGAANASVAAVRTGSTVVQPVAIAPFLYLAPELATTVTSPQQTYEDFDDGVQLLPGTSYQMQAVAAAGTSPKLTPAVLWEESQLVQGQP